MSDEAHVRQMAERNRLPRHGEVLAEMRIIEVAVRNQLDGIRPIERATLHFRWSAPRVNPGEEAGTWVFHGMETTVQGMDGSLKRGTPLSAEDYRMLGPSLGWAWDLVEQLRPRG